MIPEKLIRENGPYHAVLVGCPGTADQLVPYQLERLIHYRPDWILQGYVRYRNGKPQVCLDVTDKKSIDEAYSQSERTPETGRNILLSICRLLLLGEDDLLPMQQFSLHPSLIFIDTQINLAFWPYLEAIKEEQEDELSSLVRMIGAGFHFTEQDTEQAVRAAGNGPQDLMRHLSDSHDEKARQTEDETKPVFKTAHLPSKNTVVFVLLHVLSLSFAGLYLLGLDLIRPFLMPAAAVLVLADSCLFLRHKIKQKKNGILPFGQEPEENEDDDQTILLSTSSSDFRMAMLSEGQPGTPAEHEGRRAFILVEEFVIGRDPKKVDLCLPDPSIGRMHARIVRRAGSFFICDLGSGNGTHLDGRRLPKHEEYLLPDQCLLQFADQLFYFQAE